jgi:hypothetical protein
MDENSSEQIDETVRLYKTLKKLDPKNPLLDFIRPTPQGGFSRVTCHWERYMDMFCNRDYTTSKEVLDEGYREAMREAIEKAKEKGLVRKTQE